MGVAQVMQGLPQDELETRDQAKGSVDQAKRALDQLAVQYEQARKDADRARLDAERAKQGFSAPDGSWFKGDSIEYVRRKLTQGNPRIYEFMDRNSVHSLIDEHLTGKQNRRLFIWSLLNVEQWLQYYDQGAQSS